MKQLHFSIFLGSKLRHGGTKRSEQLTEVLSEVGFDSFNPVVGIKEAVKYCLRNPFIFLETAIFSIYLYLFKGIRLKSVAAFSLKAVYPVSLIGKYSPKKIMYETGPGFSLIFMQYLKWKKIKFIALPHNIEFMVPSQSPIGFRNSAYAFACEVDGYRAAVDVKVICDFDKSVVACLGVESSVFPYYPVESDERSFNAIRNQRSAAIFENNYLAIGTVGNKPTYEGIKSLIEYKKTNQCDFKLIIAGFGTERFAEYNSDGIVVLGSVDSQCLEKLLISCKVVLINQPQTTGFLTKIVEFNLCGIPIFILSDYHQAKSLEQQGVYMVSYDEIGRFQVQSAGKLFQKPLISNLIN